MASERAQTPKEAAEVPAPLADSYLFRGEDMGEGDLQWEVCDFLTELLRDWCAATGVPAKVGGNLPFQYDPGAQAVVVPDVYLLLDEPAEERDIGCWQTWAHGGKAPALAVEVVSRRACKDYDETPQG